MGYLENIVADVGKRLAQRRALVPLEQLAGLPTPARPPISFREAVLLPGISIIAEVKRASPSRGMLRPDLDVAQMVEAYAAGGARAVSVLTEQDHFLGDPEDLRLAASRSPIPVLRKDFILEEYQLQEARVWGASGVLLIAALLEPARVGELTESARRLGLDVLLEVHDRVELDWVARLPGVVLGINNRNLSTFEVSLETTLGLMPSVPPNLPVVSESGVSSREQILQLEEAGVAGVLIGEHLARSADPGEAIGELLGRN